MKARSIACGLILLLIGFVTGPVVAQTGAFEKGRQLEKAGEHGSAFIQYRRSFRTRPHHAPSALGLLRTGIQVEEWSTAQQALDRYEQLQPATDTAALLGVRLHYHQKNYDTALAWAERGRERLSGSWIPPYLVSRIQYARENYAGTLESLESARLRSDWNPWIEFLHIRAREQLEGYHEPSRRERLLEEADHPFLFRELADFEGIDWTDRDRANFLQRGLQYFPADPPLLAESVNEEDYRYQLGLLWLQLDNREKAREAIGPVQSDRFQSRWLRATLREDRSERVRAQGELLKEYPDQIVHQWQQSRLSRAEEGLQGEYRRLSSNFFHRAFENNRLFGYDEAAMQALIRSLELQPTVGRHQFELAEYYHDRGWWDSERAVLDRVEELGLRDPTEIVDYREGIIADTDPQAPAIPEAKLGIIVTLDSYLEGPVGGASTLKNMIAHGLHHQPAFAPDRVEEAGDTPTAFWMSRRGWDGAIDITIHRWDETLEATVLYHLSSTHVEERRFYARGRMKPWRFLDEIMNTLKEIWPWEGRVYRVEKPGAWLNLGRAHGVEMDDRFLLDGEERTVDEIHERRLRLRFPSPVLQGRIHRGTMADRILEAPPEE